MSGTIAPHASKLIHKYYPEYRERIFTPLNVISSIIISIIAGGESLTKSLSRINSERTAQNLPIASINTAALSKARTRLPLRIIQETTTSLAYESEKEASKEWTWRGMKGLIIDGTTFTVDDTPENQKKYPQHGKQKEGVGFPILRAVVIQSLTTGMITAGQYDAFKGKETGEMALTRRLKEKILEGDFVMGDRYYPSYFFMSLLMKNGMHGIFQSHGSRSVDFRKGKKIGSKDHIATWKKPSKPEWMSQEEYEKHPDTIKVRELQVKSPSKEYSRMVLVTTFIDHKEFSKESLEKVFKKRWKVELALRDIKKTLGMSHFHAKSVDMIGKLFWSSLLAFNSVRWHLMVAGKLGNRNPHSLSFKTAASVVISNLMNLLYSTKAKIYKVLADIYFQILQTRVGHRSGRSEPRGVKKKSTSPPLKISRKEWKEQRVTS